LDPHIQSHYDLKKEVDHTFSTLDTKIKTTIEAHLDTLPTSTSSSSATSSSTPATRLRSSASSVGFHQSDSKDFNVSKLQKEIKDIKLLGDTLKDLEIFWDATLCTFKRLVNLMIDDTSVFLDPSFPLTIVRSLVLIGNSSCSNFLM
jgi:hypothetical protein